MGVTPKAWLSLTESLGRVSNPQPAGHRQPRVAMNSAQNKIVNLLETLFYAHQFSLVFVCFMCDPRRLFFQCGPEMPKGWTPLQRDGGQGTGESRESWASPTFNCSLG